MDLNEREIELLKSAIDSHEYWQIADAAHRKDGFVIGPDDAEEYGYPPWDEEKAAEYNECEVLAAKLDELHNLEGQIRQQGDH